MGMQMVMVMTQNYLYEVRDAYLNLYVRNDEGRPSSVIEFAAQVPYQSDDLEGTIKEALKKFHNCDKLQKKSRIVARELSTVEESRMRIRISD